MFRPYVKQKKILFLIALINLMLVYISYNSHSYKESIDYDLKIKASVIMRDILENTYKLDSIIHIQDKFNSGLIGVDSTESKMTTKKGFFDSKRATTK